MIKAKAVSLIYHVRSYNLSPMRRMIYRNTRAISNAFITGPIRFLVLSFMFITVTRPVSR